MDHTPDNVLFDRWNASRDAEAFSEIATRYAGLVYATCRRILNDPSEAEDVAQDCFVHLLERQKGAPLGPWLHRLATYRALDRQRRNARRAQREQTYAECSSESVEPCWSDVEGSVDEAISALQDELRVPVVRHFLEGHSYATLARLLGVPKSTLAKRAQQGLDEVRAALRRKGIDAASGLAPLLVRHGIETLPPTLRASLGKLALAGTKSSIVSPLIAGGSAVVIKKVLTAIAALVAVAVLTAGGTSIYRALSAAQRDAGGTESAKPASPNPLLHAETQDTSKKDSKTPEDKKGLPRLAKAESKVPLATLLERLAAAKRNGDSTLEPVTSKDLPSDNGAHFFLLAVELMPDVDKEWLMQRMDEIRDNGWTDDPRLMAYLASCQDAFDAIREGVKRGNAELPLGRGPDEPLPYLSKYRTLAHLMATEGQMYASQGNFAAAFDDYATLAEFANESSRGGGVINALVGYTMLEHATDAAENTLVNADATAEEYRAYIARLEAIEAREASMAQAVRNDADSLNAWISGESETVEQFRTLLTVPEAGFNENVREWAADAAPEELMALMQQYIDGYRSGAEAVEIPYYETDAITWLPELESDSMAQNMVEIFRNLPRTAAHSNTLRDGTVIQAALETFRIEHGAYPSSLDQLSPAYLSSVPADPFTGQGFCYSTDSDGYSLYSAGADMRDDGGSLDDYKAPGGDLIFRAP